MKPVNCVSRFVQEGNEVVIHFSDDGQGLNLNNIRKKALQNGLVKEDDSLSDAGSHRSDFPSWFLDGGRSY